MKTGGQTGMVGGKGDWETVESDVGGVAQEAKVYLRGRRRCDEKVDELAEIPRFRLCKVVVEGVNVVQEVEVADVMRLEREREQDQQGAAVPVLQG